MPVLAPPAGLTSTVNSVGSVILKWFPVSGAISYNVYRRSDTLALLGTPINQSPITTLTFTDTAPNTTANYYSVTTVNLSGESQPSQVLVFDVNTLSSLPRVDPNVNDFNKFIHDRGYLMQWQKAMVCPCALAGKSAKDATDLFHDLCKNKEYIWTDMGQIMVLITRIQRNSNLNQDGVWEQGTMMVSTQSQNKIGFYDRLIFQESTIAFSQAIKKGASGGTDELRFPAIDVQIPIVDFEGNTYEFGIDFGLNASGNVIWGGFSNKQPNTNSSYGIVYLTQMRGLIVDYPHAIRGQQVQIGTTVPLYKDFPLQTIMKLEFFIS